MDSARKKVAPIAVAIWFILSRVMVGCHTLSGGTVLELELTSFEGVSSSSSSELEKKDLPHVLGWCFFFVYEDMNV